MSPTGSPAAKCSLETVISALAVGLLLRIGAVEAAPPRARVAGAEPGAALFRVRDASGEDKGSAGLREGPVMGSFVHLVDRA